MGIATVVTALVDGFGAAASTVEDWLSGVSQTFGDWVSAIESYLGLDLDFSCYVEIDNTNGHSALLLKGSTANSGSYVVNPPFWIPKGKRARFILRDPKGFGNTSGAQGTVTYAYTDANLNTKTVVASYNDPFWFNRKNEASASQPDWVSWGRNDPNHTWSTSQSDYGSGHPFYVGFVIGGGQPT